ncbi:acyl-CoA synthetase short-chain family member 3, mitochondrial isoform X2 [Condylostylus longicornis]|uniref:acyl-CoA synthetase short-chain family member 3, mitochondrial isoform X2 n=1 Tax=Condylostylus longicornis TaxID=2530218 RepID=UPI00244E311D|nr:acyl-CoA synthetase short-chain family member 3, mitochondrial isoform X2 [Condylostylus longicornis]
MAGGHNSRFNVCNSNMKYNCATQPPNIDNPTYLDAYRRSIETPEDFWGEVGQSLDWYKTWEKVLDNSMEPFTKWYVGGYLNACYNTIDRHILNGKGDKVALIHDSPLTNTIRHVTYNELYETTSRLAGGLRQLGVEKGDRVIIYMPLIPEAVMAVLATARLGGIHSVVFGGFAASELCTRIEHAKPKVVIAATCGVEPNKVVKYLDMLHSAIAMSTWKPVCRVIFERNNVLSVSLDCKKDVSWNTVLQLGSLAERCECVPVEANDPLYILYTSGTTDKPKGVQRPIGGHLAVLSYSMKMIYGITSNDVWWTASDLGWVVGLSYICYAPLLIGATSVMYEGKPDRTPDPGQYFRIIDQHKVSAAFSVPTAFRVIRRVDPEVKYGKKYCLDSLRTIFIAGEQCDIETKNWIERTFKVPALNNWWQTETGSAITASCVGFGHSMYPPKYTTGLPFMGYQIEVFNQDGMQTESAELGRIVIKLPLPPGNMSTLYKNDELFKQIYFQKFPGYYDTMDAGYKDQNGYVYIVARDDDVINVAGHRIATSSLEDAVLRHHDIADAAVFGVPEPTKGTKKEATKISSEIIKIIRDVIGPIASFRLAAKVEGLPRTRSGKTMRKAMADFAKNEEVTLPATIEDPTVFSDIRRALQELGYAMTAPNPILAE